MAVESQYLCKCTSVRDISEEPDLKKILPPGYKYALCEFERSMNNENSFGSKFRIDIVSQDDLKQWVEKFFISSNSFFKSRSPITDKRRILYKAVMQCHRNTSPSPKIKKPHPKHTDCKAYLFVTLKKKSCKKNYTSADFHMPKMPTVIRLKHIHNHDLNITGSKRFLKNFFTLIIRHTVSESDGPPPGIEFNARSKVIDCAAIVEEIEKQNKAKILSDVEKVFSSMKSKAQSNPAFLKAVGNFTKAYKSIVCEDDRIAALTEFGNNKFQHIDRDNELELTNETYEQNGGTEVLNSKSKLVPDIDRYNELVPTNETSEQNGGTEVLNGKSKLVPDIDRYNELVPTNETSDQNGGTENRMEVKVGDISEAGKEVKISTTVHDKVPNFTPIVHRIYPEISVAALNVKEEMPVVPCNSVPLLEYNSRTLNQFVSAISEQNCEFRIVTIPHSRRELYTDGACFVGANLRCVPR